MSAPPQPPLVPPEDTPLRVRDVDVEGLRHTHRDFVLSELREAREARTLGEVRRKLLYCLGGMRALDVFSYADVEMRPGPRGPVPLTDLLVRVKEKPRLMGKTEVSRAMGRNETYGGLTVTMRNAFGRGEAVRAELTQGSLNSQDAAVTLEKPRLWGTRHALSLGAFTLSHNNSFYSSHQERARGVRAAVTSESGVHRVEYEGVWRDVAPLDRFAGQAPSRRDPDYPGPSSAVAEAATPSLKSSLSYTFVRDRRDHAQVPRAGHFFRGVAELAGLGGDTDFLRVEALAQRYVRLTDTLSLGVGLQAGVVRPLWSARTRLPDRLHLGGPVSLRGFRQQSVGPRDGDDALGGDLSLSAAVELTFALPGRALRELGVRGHAFANAGNCVSLSAEGPPVAHQVRGLVSDLRAAAGAGVVFPLPFGRLELNYSLPVWAGSHATGVQRFQIGLAGRVWL